MTEEKLPKILSLNSGSGRRCEPRTTQIRIQACYHSTWHFWYASAYNIRRSLVPSSSDTSNGDVPQESVPGCWRGFTVHICIPDGTTAQPSRAYPRHCVSNACEPFPDLVITWQKQAQTFADDYDICVVGGWEEGSQDATWPDPTLGINFNSVPWPFLSYEAVGQSC